MLLELLIALRHDSGDHQLLRHPAGGGRLALI
jgi:hypothetical protein